MLLFNSFWFLVSMKHIIHIFLYSFRFFFFLWCLLIKLFYPVSCHASEILMLASRKKKNVQTAFASNRIHRDKYMYSLNSRCSYRCRALGIYPQVVLFYIFTRTERVNAFFFSFIRNMTYPSLFLLQHILNNLVEIGRFILFLFLSLDSILCKEKKNDLVIFNISSFDVGDHLFILDLFISINI